MAIGSNRGDCLSMYGLAREAAAAAGRQAIPPVSTINCGAIPAPEIRIEAEDLCARYSGRIVRGVKIGPSPDWLVRRLEACGMRSINNVVDVSNYVLLELGHPLHAFDLAKLSGGKIIVRRAGKDERITTLDGNERELAADMLVIADAKKPVALAGVMGGANSEVSAETVDLLLESAWFDPVSIRRTGRQAGLASEAAYRFERGADPAGTLPALERCTELILKTAGGIAGPVTDCVARPFVPRRVLLRRAFMEAKLGFPLPWEEAVGILKRLGFIVKAEDKDSLETEVPPHRNDVALEVDLVEEVIRHYGYDRLPARLFPVRVNEALVASRKSLRGDLRKALVDCGLQEVINFNFALQEDLVPFGIDPLSCATVLNPMSLDQKHLRPALVPNIARNLKVNFEHGTGTGIALFEIGKVFQAVAEPRMAEETLHAAVALSGFASLPGWDLPEGRPWDFFDLKGILDYLSVRLRLPQWRLEPGGPEYTHPGQVARLFLGDRETGWAGALHPAVQRALDFPQPVFIMELAVEGFGEMRGMPGSYRAASRFPSLLRDLAFIVDEACPAGSLASTLRRAAGDGTAVSLRSVYRGAQIGGGKKSLAYALVISRDDRTPEDEEAEKILAAAIAAADTEHGAKLR
jgi:phenylalanyl-tRNA synthetase beta chain